MTAGELHGPGHQRRCRQRDQPLRETNVLGGDPVGAHQRSRLRGGGGVGGACEGVERCWGWCEAVEAEGEVQQQEEQEEVVGWR